MKKRKLITGLLALNLLTLGAVSLAACGGDNKEQSGEKEAETFAIKRTVADHAKVKVGSSETLPTTAKAEEKIEFTVTVDDGYEVSAVKFNNKKITAKNGLYSITITKESTLVVEVNEAVGELKVTSQPSKLVYYAGDEFDATGMVVEVEYGTGRKETLELGDKGYSVYPSVFEGGETQIEVLFGGKSVVVQLEQKVEYIVTIDPKGGTISEEYLANLAALKLNNYSVSEEGVISFTYFDNLPSAIDLPTDKEITKGDSIFVGWGYEESISNFSKESVHAEANWQIGLVDVSKLDLEVEENVPYLVIEGKYRAANEVYLYLYEGNAKVSLLGDTYKGEHGADFKVKFDLTRLSGVENPDEYVGKWMDIRFNAKFGEKEESMEIYSDKVDVDTSKVIKSNLIAYSFHVYEKKMKVAFTYSKMDYTLEGISESYQGEEIDYLKIDGAVSKDYAGKYIEVTWYQGSETEGHGSVIDSDGKFSIKYPLSLISTQKTNAFAHVGIYDSAEKNETLYGGTSTNLLIADSGTAFPKLPKKLGDITNAFKYVGKNGLTYYIGYAWEGLMVYCRDESNLKEVTLDSASLRLTEGKVYYVLTGTSIGYNSENFIYDFYFQHNDNLDKLGYGDVYNPTELAKHAVVDASGNYECSICVSDLLKEQFTDEKWGLTPKIYIEDLENLIEIKPETVGKENYVVDGVRYSLFKHSSQTWGMAALILEKVTE